MNEGQEKELLQKIQSVSFAMDDVRLYLDTHPEDFAAYEYYDAYKRIRTKALNQYNRYFDPLDPYSIRKQEWSWNTKPWPWEGEMEDVDL
ncbi:spore coat protein CotJB [Anaerosporobacter faecicola]|uniref:spore coat protein CotJB n=1 Tax=Anaerosporobacter faecicola TaxID=2718714 RepID=UPI00143A60A6|nr:spore coat protein CotJB [Anaerosporobacter faecicola]